MNNNEKKNKPFSMIKLIVELGIIAYAVIYICDMIRGIFDSDSMVLFRYIPAACVAFISTFFVIKSTVKKCGSSEEESIRRKIIIVPIIVAVIIFAYGLYSVQTNMEEIEDEYSRYKNLFSNEDFDKYDEMLEEAKNEAIKVWLITSIIYLVISEITVQVEKRKLGEWLIEDGVILDNDVPIDLENYEKKSEEKDKEESTVNNIKWDL